MKLGILPRRSLDDQSLGELGMDAPVTPFVGIGQRRAPHRLAEAHMVELRRLHRQTRLDVTQALPPGQLRERHRAILLGAGKHSHATIAAIARNDPRKGAPRKEIHQLGEQRLAGIHRHLLGNPPNSARASSNRHHTNTPKIQAKSCCCRPDVTP